MATLKKWAFGEGEITAFVAAATKMFANLESMVDSDILGVGSFYVPGPADMNALSMLVSLLLVVALYRVHPA